MGQVYICALELAAAGADRFSCAVVCRQLKSCFIQAFKQVACGAAAAAARGGGGRWMDKKETNPQREGRSASARSLLD